MVAQTLTQDQKDQGFFIGQDGKTRKMKTGRRLKAVFTKNFLSKHFDSEILLFLPRMNVQPSPKGFNFLR